MSLQLVVASADDHSPTLQLWDLRHQQAPMVELLGHHRVCHLHGISSACSA